MGANASHGESQEDPEQQHILDYDEETNAVLPGEVPLTRDTRDDARAAPEPPARGPPLAAPYAPLPPVEEQAARPLMFFGTHYVDFGPQGPTQTAPAAEQVERVRMLRAEAYIEKTSLRLTAPDTSRPTSLSLEFSLDLACPGAVAVHAHCSEDVDASGWPTFAPLASARAPARWHALPGGLNQTFSLEADERLVLLDDPSASLAQAATRSPLCQVPTDGAALPVVIQIITGLPAESLAAGGAVRTGPVPAAVQCLVLYAVVDVQPDSTCVLRVLRQKLVADGIVFLLHDIYGMEADEECVVCLSEPRATVLLPCRHMCLCPPCGRELQGREHRCPICRSPFTSLLEIKKPSSSDGAEVAPPTTEAVSADSENETGLAS